MGGGIMIIAQCLSRGFVLVIAEADDRLGLALGFGPSQVGGRVIDRIRANDDPHSRRSASSTLQWHRAGSSNRLLSKVCVRLQNRAQTGRWFLRCPESRNRARRSLWPAPSGKRG